MELYERTYHHFPGTRCHPGDLPHTHRRFANAARQEPRFKNRGL